MMACAVAGTVRDAIIELLGERPMDPFELLGLLSDREYQDSEIKQAMSEMLHEGAIELSNQRMLKLGRKHAA